VPRERALTVVQFEMSVPDRE